VHLTCGLWYKLVPKLKDIVLYFLTYLIDWHISSWIINCFRLILHSYEYLSFTYIDMQINRLQIWKTIYTSVYRFIQIVVSFITLSGVSRSRARVFRTIHFYIQRLHKMFFSPFNSSHQLLTLNKTKECQLIYTLFLLQR